METITMTSCKHIRLNYFTNNPAFPFFIQYGKHEENLEQHVHDDFYELVIVLRGSANHIVGDDIFPIQKGDVFVISEDTAHGYEAPKDFKICNIMFRLDYFFDQTCDLCTMSGFHAFFMIEPTIAKTSGFSNRLTLKGNVFNEINHQLQTMIYEYEKKAWGYQTLLSSLFTTLAVTLCRYYQELSTSRGQDISPLISPISYIENHYHEEISIDTLAKMAGVSERHFSRLFRDVYHTSPGQYLLQYRVQKAGQLLDYTDMPISEIAYQCGFNDSNYFSRQFHKIYNCSPRQFRKNHRK